MQKIIALCSWLVIAFLANSAVAGLSYWDPTGTTVSATPNGTWETVTNWATTSALTASGGAWVPGNAVVFSAGTGATGAFTITINNAESVAGIFNNGGISGTAGGAVTLSGPGSISMPGTAPQGVNTSSGKSTKVNVPITGAAIITPEGSGQLYLNATNTYSGGTSLGFSSSTFTGIVNFNNSNSFGTGIINVSNTGTATGALVVEGSSAITITNAWKMSSLVNTNSLNIVGNAAGVTFSGPWNLVSTATIGAGVSGNLVIISGVMSGAGALNKFNPAILKLSGANTYSGGTSVSNGTLQLGVAGGIPSGANKGLVTVATPGILDVHGVSGTVNGLMGDGTVNNSTGTGTLNVGAANTNSSFTGIFENTAGTFNLTKTGTGMFTISGANTYSGNTTVSAGMLQLANDYTIPSASPVIVTTGATLDLGGRNQTVASLSGGGSIINNAANLIVGGDLSTNSFNTYSCFFGPIDGGNVIKDGSHALALRQTNMYAAAFYFNNGVVSVGAGPDRLPPSTSLSIPSGGLFQLDANDQTISSLSGSGSVNLGGGTLTLNTGGYNFFNGAIQDSELPGSSTAPGHGLRGYYYDNSDMTSLKAVRDDATVNFSDLTSPAQMPADLYPNTNQFSVRWLGQVLTTVAGTYTFTTTSDDGQRLWVNGTNLIDDWVGHAATAKSGSISLAANTRYDLVMEYFNGTSLASTKLAWTPPGDSVSSVIPTDFLFLPGPGKLVLTGGGVLVLGVSNSYTGGTIVGAGMVEGSADGALGGGNVIVSNAASLALDSGATNGYLSTAADLLINSTSQVQLNYGGTNTIHAFSTDGGATYRSPGTYGSSGSGATFELGQLSGSGFLYVTAVPSASVLSSSGSPSVYGSSVTFTSTVTGSGGTPTGTVTFYDGASAIGQAALDGAGKAMLTVSDFLVTSSPHSVIAVYGGDAVYAQSTSAAVSQVITPLTISPDTVTMSNKVYDATVNASLASATFAGIVSSDTNYVHLTGAYAFADKTVGTNKTVTLTNLVLAGSFAGNYFLSPSNATSTANITAKALTVTNITANGRVYDSTTNTTVNTGAALLLGAIGGDDVALDTSGAFGTFATATVGNNKTVTVRGLALTGGDAGNYTVTPPTTTASITKASTTNVLISSQNPAASGAGVSFTSTPTPIAPGAGIPTGNVIFQTNTVAFSTNALAAGSAASLAVASLPVGTNTITAQYAGDANFVGSTNTLQQVVTQPAANPNLTIVRSGTNVILNWTGSFTLQSAPTVNGVNSGFTNLPGPVLTGPYTNGILGTSLFFRLTN